MRAGQGGMEAREGSKEHWEKIYQSKSADQVSGFLEHAVKSQAVIRWVSRSLAGRIIAWAVGCGLPFERIGRTPEAHRTPWGSEPVYCLCLKLR